MSTKRVKVREMKRKQKQQRRTLIFCGIGLLLLMAAGIAVYTLDAYSKSYIMTYEGEKIKTTDFTVFALSATDQENLKAEALDKLLRSLALKKAAAENHIVLSEEDESELEGSVSGFRYVYEYYGMDISAYSDEQLRSMMLGDMYYDKLLAIYTADYTLDAADFETALADYKENNKVDYYDTQLKYIITETEADIEAAKAAIDGGMDFDEAVKEYSTYYDEETGVDTYNLKSFGMTEEDNAALMALTVGEVSEIYPMDERFVLFCVASITIPTDEELTETYREQYTNEKKREMFDGIIDEWKASAEYTLNQKAYDAA